MLGSITQGDLTIGSFIICSVVSLLLGLGISAVHMYRNTYSKSFVITLALLPAIVQTVIMLVNGNLGTGVAVMGAFSLIRFRSVPGSAREIGSIFLAMAVGLATGMGYIAFAVIFLALIGAAMLLLNTTHFGEEKQSERMLKITIPENLDYDGLFDDLFTQYLSKANLISVRTSNMGSLYELHYLVRLKGGIVSKEFMDQLRCRNGNLTIVCGRVSASHEEL